MIHEDILYISYHKYQNLFLLLICIAKNFILTLKASFSIYVFFLHPQIPDFQILSQPQLKKNWPLWQFFLVQGHILVTY